METKLTRRGFFKALAATAIIAVASTTKLGKITSDLLVERFTDLEYSLATVVPKFGEELGADYTRSLIEASRSSMRRSMINA